MIDFSGRCNSEILNVCSAFLRAMASGEAFSLEGEGDNPFRKIRLSDYSLVPVSVFKIGSKEYKSYAAKALDCFDAVLDSPQPLSDDDFRRLARNELTYLRYRRLCANKFSSREFALFLRALRYFGHCDDHEAVLRIYLKCGLLTPAQEKRARALIFRGVKTLPLPVRFSSFPYIDLYSAFHLN